MRRHWRLYPHLGPGEEDPSGRAAPRGVRRLQPGRPAQLPLARLECRRSDPLCRVQRQPHPGLAGVRLGQPLIVIQSRLARKNSVFSK